MATPTIVQEGSDGSFSNLQPTTLDKLGKSEADLESIIASQPHLLELEAQVEGIQGPFAIFRQYDLTNSLDLAVVPDLVIFSASGHVIIVEVKLWKNPELRNRKVLAQVMDYASAFADTDPEELTSIFNKGHRSGDTWEELIATLFPESPYQEHLAKRISDRLWSGEVILIVACDRAPVGLVSLLSGVSRQSAVPFEIRLAEITPYVSEDTAEKPWLFVSKTKLRTEIVSRTVVTVQYSGTALERPSVHVETTSMDDIEQRMAEASEARVWTDEEIEQAFSESDSPVIRKLFEMARYESNANRFASPGPKRNPAFGFYLRGIGPDGIERTAQVFNHRMGENELRVYLNMVETLVPKGKYVDFVRRLEELFPESKVSNLREPCFPVSAIEERLAEFRRLILWLKEE